MLPIALLMEEHRLIERLITLIHTELDSIETAQKVDPVFIDAAVDFFKTYADRTHHGKEEDILFREIGQKPISNEHKKTLEDLLIEHVYARKQVMALLETNKKYKAGDNEVLTLIQEILHDLCLFYPKHIEKEDKHFFVPVMNYFSKKELEMMMNEFNEWDRSMIHEKYRSLVELLEKK